MMVRESLLLAKEKIEAALVSAVSGNGCKTMEDYRYLTGQIKGINDLWRELDGILKRALDEDE